MKHVKNKTLFLLVCSAFVASACAHQTYTFDNGLPAPLSRRDQKEIEVGRMIDEQITDTYYLYDDQRLTDYVTRLGQDLARHAHRSDLPYSFRLLYDQRIYATAAPGGFIYLTTGLIDFVDTEAELAAALAHEIGRVQYSDPSFSEAKKQFDALRQGGLVIAPMFGSYGALAALGLHVADTHFFTKKSLSKIMVLADRYALEYLQKAEYDPQGLIDFLHKIHASRLTHGPLLVNYLASHPLAAERLAKAERHFKEIAYDGKTYFQNSIEFLQVTEPVRQLYQRPQSP